MVFCFICRIPSRFCVKENAAVILRDDRILHGERDENGQVSHRVGEINYAPAIPVQGTRYCLPLSETEG